MAKGNSIDHSTDLVLDNVSFEDDAHVLIISAASPRLIRTIAGRVATLDVFDLSHRALSAISDEAQLTIQYGVFPSPEPIYDAAVMFVPKGRDLARAQIWSAHHALKPGGTLYIAGPTKGGAKSVLADASVIFGNTNVLAYRKSHRVGMATRTADGLTGFPANWGADPTQPQQLTYDTPHGPLPVTAMPGVFSWQALDDGTHTLLENVDFSAFAGLRVLDVGCGAGVLGVLAAKHADHVTLIDDNLLAVRCTEATITQNNVDNAQVHAGDVYGPVEDQKFDVILSNPPFHKYFDVNTNTAAQIITKAPEMLNPGGKLILVANAFLPYKREMEPLFSTTREIIKTSRYVVLEGTV